MKQNIFFNNGYKKEENIYSYKNPNYVFIIASYNNEKNVELNISSVALQLYKNWRIIYINDFSTDKTSEILNKMVVKHNIAKKIHIIENKKNMKQAYSKYIGYQLVEDNEIVCILDGDDWLKNDRVLLHLNQYYNQEKYHIVTSNFSIYEDGKIKKNYNRKYNNDVIKYKHFRYSSYSFCHLKSGLGIYFKSIPEKYFKYKDEWLDICTDVSEMNCVSELCKENKIISIDEVLYVYNKDNSLTYKNSWYNKDPVTNNKYCKIHSHILSQPQCNFSIPKTFVIHVDEYRDLERNMYGQMNIINKDNWEIFSAYTPDNIQNIIIQEKKYFENSEKNIFNDLHSNLFNVTKRHCTEKALSLIVSNLKLFEKIEKEYPDLDHVAIFEDDIYTHKKYNELLFINEHNIQNKDIIYLGCHNENENIYCNSYFDKKFINIENDNFLYYGAYSLIMSKKARQHILKLGVEYFIKNNLSYDIFLNFIRLIENSENLSFYKYHYQLFIPNVVKEGIQIKRNASFYTKRNMNVNNYYIFK